eukprot:scaffold40055_cov18-Tisochrysis_lutea.AAC.2
MKRMQSQCSTKRRKTTRQRKPKCCVHEEKGSLTCMLARVSTVFNDGITTSKKSQQNVVKSKTTEVINGTITDRVSQQNLVRSRRVLDLSLTRSHDIDGIITEKESQQSVARPRRALDNSVSRPHLNGLKH